MIQFEDYTLYQAEISCTSIAYHCPIVSSQYPIITYQNALLAINPPLFISLATNSYHNFKNIESQHMFVPKIENKMIEKVKHGEFEKRY